VRLNGLFIAAPSCVRTGEEFSLGLKVLCAPYAAPVQCYQSLPSVGGRYNLSPRGIRYMDNVPPAWSGCIELDGGEGYVGPARWEFDSRHRGPYAGDGRPITRVEGLRYDTPGLKFIVAREPVSGIQARSNPVMVTDREPGERLWWGDIHCQTFFSDGLRCPEELYAFARHEAFLDIFALSDHAEFLTDRQWDYFTAVTNDSYEPGVFVTLLGLEWTSPRFGHRNVYYPGERGPILRADAAGQDTLEALYGAARDRGALVVPHHSANAAMGVPWELGHDAHVERLCEVHSVWGNSERPRAAGNPFPIRAHGGEKTGQHVLDALRMGRRYGLIGGGDIHDGRPGDELHHLQHSPRQYRLLHRQGIMGVWARELTREAVFEALWNRRCYATMNVRVYLRFSVCGTAMGGVVQHTGRRPISLTAASEVPIARVELVRSGEDWRCFEPGECLVRLEVQDMPASRPDWYYARVTRADGLMAWSSPVWVNHEAL